MLEYSASRRSGPTGRVGRARRRGLNENLARETSSSHLGVGATLPPADVREFAELLTGLSVSARAARFRKQATRGGGCARPPLWRRRPSLADIDGALADLA